jgi:hypothetical protein
VVTNEINQPYVVEIAVGGDGLNIVLSRLSFISRDALSCDLDEDLHVGETKFIMVGAFPIY